MTRQIVALAAAFGVLAQDAAFAYPEQSMATAPPAELAWDELAAFVVDKQITTVLPDGARITGEVLAVRPEALVLDIQKSSRRSLHPLGQTEVPRQDVWEVGVIRHTGAVFRVLGGILGGIGGLFGAAGISAATGSLAAIIPAFILLIPFSATAGYYAGKLADRRVTHIRIRPALTAALEER